MITILQNGSGIKFTFDSNDHYLQDGEIEVPVNSLSLIMDDSEMFTFVKAQSNDIFLSAKYNDVNGGMTREQLEAFFKNNMVASNLGSSISEIYVGTSADTVDANTGVVTKYDGDKQWLNIVYQDQQGYYSMTKINLNEFIIEGETGSGVTTNADGVIIGQVDPRSEEVYTAYDISGNPSTSASVLSVNESGFTVDNIQTAIDGKTLIDRRLYTPKEGVYDNTTQRITFKSDLNDSLFEVQLTIDPTLDSGSTNAVANSAITNAIDEIDSVASAALNDLNVRIIDVASAVSSAITSGEVQTMIDESVSGKQDTLIAGENITISGNVISAEGGGSSYTAGEGIIITGSSNAITLDANIYKGNGIASVSVNNPSGSGNGYNKITGMTSFGAGWMVTTNNIDEAAFGYLNKSNGGSQQFTHSSGDTLFSVGNGTADNARHNAFEIRQNGDIYITSGGTDIKLQDNLGGGEVSSAITSGDTNAVAGGAVYDKFDEVEQVTAAALNTLQDKFSSLDATIGNINTILESI